MRSRVFRILTAAILAGATASTAVAMCIPFPCEDCAMRSAGQINLVVMDREGGTVTLIPNIRFVGNAEDFTLLVPTPSVPFLEPVDTTVWDEAFAMTAPVNAQLRNDGFGCGNEDNGARFFVDPATDAEGGGGDDIVVHNRQTVAGFLAETVSASSTAALTAWMVDHGFDITPGEAAAFGPYIERDWVFTAMLIDPQKPPTLPPGGWDNNVDPVAFVYEADRFEVPLPILDINRESSLPMAFFIVDDHRTELEGFTTVYANEISRSELRAIREEFPVMGGYLDRDRFLTRLDRNFTTQDAFEADLPLRSTSDDREFRRIRSALDSWPAVLIMLLVAVGAAQKFLFARERFGGARRPRV